MAATFIDSLRSISVIRLTGGRGTVVGEIIHINPNYLVVLDDVGVEVYVAQRIILSVQTRA